MVCLALLQGHGADAQDVMTTGNYPFVLSADESFDKRFSDGRVGVESDDKKRVLSGRIQRNHLQTAPVGVNYFAYDMRV